MTSHTVSPAPKLSPKNKYTGSLTSEKFESLLKGRRFKQHVVAMLKAVLVDGKSPVTVAQDNHVTYTFLSASCKKLVDGVTS